MQKDLEIKELIGENCNVCVRACVRACVHACVRACVRACMRACETHLSQITFSMQNNKCRFSVEVIKTGIRVFLYWYGQLSWTQPSGLYLYVCVCMCVSVCPRHVIERRVT